MTGPTSWPTGWRHLAEDLADLALDRLRLAADDPDQPEGTAAAAEERRITRARRSVEKAVALLRG